MGDQHDLDRAARHMRDHYGSAASIRARRRANLLLQSGEQVTAMFWETLALHLEAVPA